MGAIRLNYTTSMVFGANRSSVPGQDNTANRTAINGLRVFGKVAPAL